MAETEHRRIVAYLCGTQANSLKERRIKLSDINNVKSYLKTRYKKANVTVYDLLSRFGGLSGLYDPSMGDLMEEYKLDIRNKITEKQDELKKMPDDKLVEYAEKLESVLRSFHMENAPSTGKPPVFEIYDRIEDASMVKAFSVAGLTKWAKPEEASPLAQLNPKTPKELPDIELVRGIKGIMDAVIVTEEIGERLGKKEKTCKEALKDMRLADFFPGRMVEPAAVITLRRLAGALKEKKL